MSEKIPMTVNGFKMIQEKLNTLKTQDRSDVIKAIATARALGDLSENAEYSAAKERQSFIETKIIELSNKIANAHVVDLSNVKNDGKVVFGAKVKIINCDTDNEYEYTIVGEDESDLKNYKISFKSPLAKAIIGKYVGDVIHVETPKGDVEYEILHNEYVSTAK